MEVDTVVMALGTSPNPLIRMADEALDVNGKGCFIVNEETMETVSYTHLDVYKRQRFI